MRSAVDSFVILMLVFVVALHLLATTHGFAAFPGGDDGRFNQVILEHLYRWVTGEASQLFSPKFFYPFPKVLDFSDNHFGSGFVYVISRLLGASREVAFDVWFVVGYIVTFAAATYSFRKIGLSAIAAVVGACIFTINLPMLAQEVHAQLVYRFAIPLAVLALANYGLSKRKEDLFLIVIWTAWQFFCSIYLGIFLLMLLVTLTAAHYLIKRNSRQPLFRDDHPAPPISQSQTYALGVAAIVILILLLAMLLEYHFTARAYGFSRGFSEIQTMLPRPSSYLLADGSPIYSWLGSTTTNIPMRWEHQLFPGIAAIIPAAWGVGYGIRNDRARYYVIPAIGTLAFLVLLTTSISGFSLYFPLAFFPGTNAIRAVSRIVIALQLLIATLAAFGIEAIGMRRMFVRAPLFIALGAFLAAEVLTFQTTSTKIASAQSQISQLASGLDLPLIRAQKGIIFRLTEEFGSPGSDVDAMILAQDQGLATFNGYSGNQAPVSYWPKDCIEAARMLAEIPLVKVGKIVFPSFDELARRAIVLPVGKCSDLSAYHFEPLVGALPDNLPAKIELAIVGVEKQNADYLATIRITNHSDMLLPSFSSSGNPVRLSWRFTSDPTALNPSKGWSTRQNLPADIPPQTSQNVIIRFSFPSSSPFYLQVSMVQEAVMWFHDHGMRIATTGSPL